MSNNKSFIAKIEETVLKFLKPEYMDSKDKADDFINDRLNAQEKPVKSIFKSFDFNGMQVFTFGNDNAQNTILYIHGGAYISEINYQHFIYCYLLARKLNAHVLAPVYPLAPKHSANDAFEAITELYKSRVQKNNLIMMGDSAGGGFVYSFCQYLKTVNLEQPDKIITFSPWVDISMSSPPYNSSDDPILGEIGLKEIGKSWAGDLSTKDYRVSPLFGDSTDLADTLIFAGENEIFYSDIRKYAENLKRDGVNVKLVTGAKLFHIYPLFPIPEAKNVLNDIKRYLDD
ncbi:alpha/beta hydrolase fold domain-containing protein [Methanobrevibacter sp.]|uniref:alpha/beta hydrolase fold domain-containing protein n=1 Tax=Methanobrevibacter sp. TaxID=66852 RepID=UPI00386884ED